MSFAAIAANVVLGRVQQTVAHGARWAMG